MTYRDAMRAALIEEMDRDDSVLLMGEDIGVYQGTFRITAGLLERYGGKRVIDTPISELGVVGAAIGMAMTGLRPIVEVMTWNFALLAVDQILQNAAKLRYFSGGQVSIPVVIRGPNGAGVQLSAQHSQSFESLYAHFPGLTVVAPADPVDARGMLKSAVRGQDPVIFLENASLYSMKSEVPEDEGMRPLKGARVVRPGNDVTVVSYSRMLHLALAAAQQLASEGIEAEVIDLRALRPLDLDPVIGSIGRTHRAVVVQEQWKPFGAAAEIGASIAEQAFDQLDAPVERVTGQDVPMPYARGLESLSVPHESDVMDAVRRSL
jgi:pyruvate dehydrogenase E1 component beta subunit